MIRLLAPCLIVLTLLTGIALGAARGQVMAGGQVVLCSGDLVTVVTLNAGGQPVGHTHVCPDMALSLMAGWTVEALHTPPLRRARPVDPASAGLRATPHPAPPATARGPPPLVV